MQSNYYIVKAVCGHVGKGMAVDKDFAVRANSGKEAASIARTLPRVKHDMKYAIKSVLKVCYEDYINQRSLNDSDPYLRCLNRQEQNYLCPSLNVYSIKIDEEEKLGKKVSRKAYVNNYCFHYDNWEEWGNADFRNSKLNCRYYYK